MAKCNLMLLLLLLLTLFDAVCACRVYVRMTLFSMCVSEWRNEGWRGEGMSVFVYVLTKKVLLSSANHNDRQSSSSIETEDNKELS